MAVDLFYFLFFISVQPLKAFKLYINSTKHSKLFRQWAFTFIEAFKGQCVTVCLFGHFLIADKRR